ncbi:type IV toxin-antitoxin system AbiEi family antitoxin domain-containing protein [Williamsia sp. CHRR-6]|uniref:type IV toxin-antitoxin system AbiEi family antitoxin domain-containing protein n=1 Tax=Williamsia sp. CHRR-6 TaxID=2835871 RepID=UPI001BDB40AB|nr:type IV toxin-antitoxin system AbiEi family antitoxin domain-containing protein [Williamsia sp. CHRR-6]MBT0566667.1 DUF559 domain-containing protein [Williamsia sp. CHRR-6]
MGAELRRHLAERDGVITRKEALRLGLSGSAVGRRVDNGEWRCVGRGIYVVDDRRLDDRARMRIACARVGEGAVLAGSAAAWWHGIAGSAPRVIAVIAPRGRSGGRIPGLRLTHRELDPRDVVELSGLRVVTSEFAVLEAAACEADVALLDVSLLRRRVTLDGLWAVHRRYPLRRGATSARRVLEAAQSGARSEAEHRVHRVLRQAGINGWQANVEVDGYVGDLVFVQARLIVEIDGMAFHSDAAAFQRDRSRQNALVNVGWRVLRFTWADVTSRPDHVAASIRTALHRR